MYNMQTFSTLFYFRRRKSPSPAPRPRGFPLPFLLWQATKGRAMEGRGKPRGRGAGEGLLRGGGASTGVCYFPTIVSFSVCI